MVQEVPSSCVYYIPKGMELDCIGDEAVFSLSVRILHLLAALQLDSLPWT